LFIKEHAGKENKQLPNDCLYGEMGGENGHYEALLDNDFLINNL